MRVETFETALDNLRSNPVDAYHVNGVSYLLRHHTPAPMRVYDCNECTRRVARFGGLYGPQGNVLAAAGCVGWRRSNDGASSCVPCEFPKVPPSSAIPAQIVVVTQATFPAVEEGVRERGADGSIEYWPHLTVFTKGSLTDADVAAQFDALWRKYKEPLALRLDRIRSALEMDAESLARVAEAALRSDHPDYWTPTLAWLEGILAFEDTTDDGIARLVYALTTGARNDDVHFDFHKLEHVVDFVKEGNTDDIIRAMNFRRDERRYQVSEIARAAEAKHGVKDPRTISLAWDDRADLDLHVCANGKMCCYQHKNVGGMRLNFDANVGTNCERNPVENVSVRDVLPGAEYVVYVNNFSSKTIHRHDIPFQILIKREGRADVVHDGVWPASKPDNTTLNSHNMIRVCSVRFDEYDPPDVEMSVHEARRTVAHQPDWDERIGNPVVRVALASDMPGKYKYLTVSSASLGTPRVAVVGARAPSLVAQFDRLALQKCKQKDKLRIPSSFVTLQSFFEFVLEHDLPVKLRVDQVSVGYYTMIGTKTPVVHGPSPCHYRDVGRLPTMPTSRGNARGNREFFPGLNELDVVDAVGVVLDSTHNTCFVALRGARLPPVDSQTFPLGSGMYATSLKPEAHVHRSKFHTIGTLLKPEAPKIADAKDAPLIGGFLFGHNEVFLVGAEQKRVVVDYAGST